MLEIIAIAVLSVAASLVYYLSLVPEGPACPKCGSGIRRAREAESSRLLGLLLREWTEPGWCPVCDWMGRVRRGAEHKRVRSWESQRREER